MENTTAPQPSMEDLVRRVLECIGSNAAQIAPPPSIGAIPEFSGEDIDEDATLPRPAKEWYRRWEAHPCTWEQFREDLCAVFVSERKLHDRLTCALQYTSDLATSYVEYARTKLTYLRQTQVSFITAQQIELIVNTISDSNVRQAMLNGRSNLDKMASDDTGVIPRTPRKKTAKTESRTTVSPPKTRRMSSIEESVASGPSGLPGKECLDPDWSQLRAYVKCIQHSDYPINRVSSGETVLSWEWNQAGLNLYYFGKGLGVPATLTKVAPHIYASTTRSAMSVPTDGSTLGDGSDIIAEGGVLLEHGEPVEPDKLKGSVIVSEDSYYIIAGGKKGEPLPPFRPGPAARPTREAIECSFCARPLSSTSSVSRDVMDAVEERAHVEPDRDGDGWIHQIPFPTFTGQATVSEHSDYWGVKYDEVKYDDWTFLRCREASIFAGHTVVGPGLIEIYPDIMTRQETLRLTTASMPNPCFYTDDETGRCYKSQGKQTFLLMRHRSLSY
ncbi:hypothetical protein ANTRET_LOCUS9528 [Anthophora retusa]